MSETSNLTFTQFTSNYLSLLQEGIKDIPISKLEEATLLISQAKKVWICGNGGSLNLGDHFATDLLLAGVKAISLSSPGNITCFGNDDAFRNCFANQVRLLCEEGDLLILLSTSGNSPNIVGALGWAEHLHLKVLTLTGGTGGVVGNSSKDVLHLNIPSTHTGVIQDLHQTLMHLICYYLMEVKKEV